MSLSELTGNIIHEPPAFPVPIAATPRKAVQALRQQNENFRVRSYSPDAPIHEHRHSIASRSTVGPKRKHNSSGYDDTMYTSKRPFLLTIA